MAKSQPRKQTPRSWPQTEKRRIVKDYDRARKTREGSKVLRELSLTTSHIYRWRCELGL